MTMDTSATRSTPRSFLGVTGSSAISRRIAIVALGAVCALAFGPLQLGGDYASFLVAAIAYNAITVLSLSLLAGYSGIWSMAQPAFVAIGAYVTANLAAAGYPIELVVPVIAIAAGLVGFLLGITAGRFSILYFGLLTLAVSLTATEVIGRWSAVTGGDEGLAIWPVPSLLLSRELEIGDGPALSILMATLVFLIYDIVVKGVVGRRWKAVKSQRTAAIGIGIVPHLQNAYAFAVSAGLASLAGACMAVSIGYIEPGAFGLDAGVMMIVATVIGGVGSFAGAIVGAAFLVGIPELGRSFTDLSAFIFGASVILVLLFLPKGIVPSLLDLVTGRARRSAPLAADHPGGAETFATTTRIMKLASVLMPRSTRPLVVEKLNVSFGGLKALQQISFTIEPGKTVGLIGPNGAGKTTVLNSLSGFITVGESSILRIGDESLVGAAPWMRRKIGFARTFQHAELFEELSVRDNLIVAAANAGPRSDGRVWTPDEVADRIIADLNIADVAGRYPSELPFGMQKVVDIGRVLALAPQVVALDEPFSGLDQQEFQELRAILQGMRQAGVSILLIDHAVKEVLDISDSIVAMDFGKVLAIGSPEDIQKDSRVREAYFGSSDRQRIAAVEGAKRFGPPIVHAEGVTHRYGGVLAVEDVSLGIKEGSFAALLGANGAGKSTLSLVLSGILRPTKGKVAVDNRADLRNTGTARTAGICLIPEGRRLFGQLSVRENLMLGAYGAKQPSSAERLEEVVRLLPKSVQDGLDRACVTLSGGERQMVALGRALMARPRLLIVDEPSMGLAPILIEQFYSILEKLSRENVSVLVVEQLATHALQYADTIVVMNRGRVTYSGLASDAAAEIALLESLGGTKDADVEVDDRSKSVTLN